MRSDFLWAPANTFLFKFPYKTIIVKNSEISDSFLAKTACQLCHWKGNKKLHITHYGYFDFRSFC